MFKNEAHFMGYYKRCITNHIHWLSITRTEESQITATRGPDGELIGALDMVEVPERVDSELELHLALKEAPDMVRRLIEACDRKRRPRVHRKRGGVRETTNEFLCRIAQVDPTKHDLKSLLDEFRYGLQEEG